MREKEVTGKIKQGEQIDSDQVREKEVPGEIKQGEHIDSDQVKLLYVKWYWLRDEYVQEW